MWLPTPLYERVPQFWFLLGLLFVACGLLLGFEFVLSFWYIAIGFTCCAVGAGTLLLRLRNRQAPRGIQQTASPQQSAPAEPEYAQPAHAE